MGRRRPALVTVHPAPGGVELHALDEDGREVVLAMGALDGLTLADDITIVCERPAVTR